VVWVQEEPENMGAWRALQPRLAALVRDRARLSYIGRPERASPAEGFANAHEREQRRIVEAALTVPAPRRRAARSAQRGSPAGRRRGWTCGPAASGGVLFAGDDAWNDTCPSPARRPVRGRGMSLALYIVGFVVLIGGLAM